MTKKIVRAATIGMSLNIFCKDVLKGLKEEGYEVLALSSPDEDLKELGEREGVRTIGIPMERHVSPLKDFVSLVRLVCVLRREKPDMVHSMTPKAGLLCIMASWVARVPVRIHTFTGLVWPTARGLSRQILMMTDKMTCACATHVIPEGEGVKQDLQRSITRKPMNVLGYGNVRGVILQYSRRSEEKAKTSVFMPLFVGRIVKDKGMNELIPAFVRLNQTYQEARLLLVGPSEDELDPVSCETKQLIDTCEAIERSEERRVGKEC